MTARFDNQDGRVRGRALQARRLRVWSRDPFCAKCRALVQYPSGFDLDHKVSLEKGGPDTDENCQVLCNGPEGCHRKKTEVDMGFRARKTAGPDGWPQ